MNAHSPRQTVLLLAVAQALYSCCIITVFSTAGLVGLTIAPDQSLATLPVTTFVVGSMAATIPASFLMRRWGRKPIFLLGAVSSIIGALLAVWAIFNGAFIAFCIATALQGVFQATSNYYRFAAVEASDPDNKSVAISWVLTGGVVAAVAGTLIASSTSNYFPLFMFAGSYAASVILALANFAIVATLQIPKPTAEEVAGPQRSWGELLQQPRLIVAMASAIIAYALMNLMMTAAPVAMKMCGFDVAASSWVIQWHVLGMFVPSFFTGVLIKRYGVNLITSLGMLLLITAAIAGLAGITFGHFAVGLILLGLGWNFGFIGGTTMLTECYRPSERAKVQAANDFGISAMMAIASASSGQMLSHWGWHSVPIAIFPFAALALALIAWQMMRKSADREQRNI
jgi:MFS family permease